MERYQKIINSIVLTGKLNLFYVVLDEEKRKSQLSIFLIESGIW